MSGNKVSVEVSDKIEILALRARTPRTNPLRTMLISLTQPTSRPRPVRCFRTLIRLPSLQIKRPKSILRLYNNHDGFVEIQGPSDLLQTERTTQQTVCEKQEKDFTVTYLCWLVGA